MLEPERPPQSACVVPISKRASSEFNAAPTIRSDGVTTRFDRSKRSFHIDDCVDAGQPQAEPLPNPDARCSPRPSSRCTLPPSRRWRGSWPYEPRRKFGPYVRILQTDECTPHRAALTQDNGLHKGPACYAVLILRC